MYLVAVDGDQAASAGMTAEELASFLTGIGVSDALELDGGGSSTLYVRKEGGVVNSPSDGVQRPVANHLGITYGAQTHFSVVGFVFDTNFGNRRRRINNATVTVDGQTRDLAAANNHTLYNVNNITPHYVCAHASAPGFMSATQCREITAQDVQSQGATQYLSLVLYQGHRSAAGHGQAARHGDGPPAGRRRPVDPDRWRRHGRAAPRTRAVTAAARRRRHRHLVLSFALVLFLGAASIFRRRRE